MLGPSQSHETALVYYVLRFTRYKVQPFLVMSDQNFVLSDQDGVFSGTINFIMSFQQRKIIFSPAVYFVQPVS